MVDAQTGLEVDILKKITGIAKACFPNADILLFGSRASGKYHQSSDIDIAIKSKKKLNRLDIVELKDMLNASNISYSFDVVDFNELNSQMQESILANNIKLS